MQGLLHGVSQFLHFLSFLFTVEMPGVFFFRQAFIKLGLCAHGGCLVGLGRTAGCAGQKSHSERYNKQVSLHTPFHLVAGL